MPHQQHHVLQMYLQNYLMFHFIIHIYQVKCGLQMINANITLEQIHIIAQLVLIKNSIAF